MKHYLQTMVWAALKLIKTNSPSKAEGFKMIEMLPSTRVLVCYHLKIQGAELLGILNWDSNKSTS
jgi:hypothetical protein